MYFKRSGEIIVEKPARFYACRRISLSPDDTSVDVVLFPSYNYIY